MSENPSKRVWVLASPELLEEMRRGWSRAVQVHAEPNADGSWEMTFRTFTEQTAREAEPYLDTLSPTELIDRRA